MKFLVLFCLSIGTLLSFEPKPSILITRLIEDKRRLNLQLVDNEIKMQSFQSAVKYLKTKLDNERKGILLISQD